MKYIIVTADIVPTINNMHLFDSGDVKELVGTELRSVFENACYRIANLETPLTDNKTPIKKTGPNLIAPVSSIKGIKELKIDLVTIGNNHILDQDMQGLYSTIHVLEKNNISHVGGGESIADAMIPFFFNFSGKRVGVYACTEREFSFATEFHGGANPFDPIMSFDHVKNMNSFCDYSIVLYHGGKEFYKYPSPNLQRICHKFVESGADLVICQHSHTVGCEEKYKGSTIIYGQGNFIFDSGNTEHSESGLLIKLNENFEICYIPIIKMDFTVRLATGKSYDEIINGFKERSKNICKYGFVKDSYDRLLMTEIINYLVSISNANNSLLNRLINKISKGKYYNYLVRKHYQSRRGLFLLDVMNCESHRESILRGLELLLGRDS